MSRAVCCNCMDGRAQLPVIEWIKAHHRVDFVDLITEAGMDGFIANPDSDIREIVRSINISITMNGAIIILVAGHHDCRGNPVEKARHVTDIKKAVARIRQHFPRMEIAGLWVNDNWQVEKISDQNKGQ